MGKPCKKVRHQSKSAALTTARRAHKNEPMNAYVCEKCGFWHLGSSMQSNRIQDRFDRLLRNPPKLKWPKPVRTAGRAALKAEGGAEHGD